MKLVACVAAVGEDGGYRGKALQSVDDEVGRAIAVLNVGAMDVCTQKNALRIDGDRALASLELLARVIARYAAAFGRLDALAVNDCGTRIAVAAHYKAAGDCQKLADN